MPHKTKGQKLRQRQAQCGKPMPAASNGNDRGTCTRLPKHGGGHSNRTCYACGAKLAPNEKSGDCNKCHNDRAKQRRNRPMNYQHAGEHYIFRCGCSGILPVDKKESNKFASQGNKGWFCRVSKILGASQRDAKRGGYVPIDVNTPHATIRQMMEEPCVHCGEALDWTQLGRGKTPHLDHDHETGEVNGFSHQTCNPRALKIVIEKLKADCAQALKRAA
jgi:hypothetical protein